MTENLLDESKVYSTHHFMFAFKWDSVPIEKLLNETSFKEKNRLNSFEESMNNKLWKRSYLQPQDFNHFTYFYDFVRSTIYDSTESNSRVRYFECNLNEIQKNEKDRIYEIAYLYRKYDKQNDSKNYDRALYDVRKIQLTIVGISLHVFNTGVGILTFNLENRIENQASKEVVLKINELGRRLYPQFLNFNELDVLRNVKRVFLSEHIKLFNDETWKESFLFYKRENLHRLNTSQPIRMPVFINKLIGNLETTETKICINPVTDDRMFFVSWYGNNGFSKIVGEKYFCCDWWYAYIFGDKSPKSIANNEMQNKQLINHSYERWSDYGTLYGMSRDSLVALTSDEETCKVNDYPNFKEHNDTIYYQMAVLCLAQRSSILRYSGEIALVTEQLGKGCYEKQKQSIQELYVSYLEFINKLHFREITSQIQGIEMYNKMREVMNINNDVERLGDEMHELHNYISIVEQSKYSKEAEKQTEAANRISIIAALFIPATVIFSILGANIYDGGTVYMSGEKDCNAISWIVLGGILSVVISFLLYRYLKFLDDKKI